MTGQRERSGEAIDHVDATGHRMDYYDEHETWACVDCSWVDSGFTTIVTNE